MAKVAIDPTVNFEKVQIQDEKQAMQIDTRLMAGPLAERGCTDFICFLLFIGNFILTWYVSIYGYKSGQPDRLFAVYDSDGKACGLDYQNITDYQNYKYLYFVFPYATTFNRTVCVSQCPNNISSLTTQPSTAQLQCINNSQINSCNISCGIFSTMSSSFSSSSLSVDTNLKNYVCQYNTSIAFERLCYPSDVLSLLASSNSFSNNLNMDYLSSWMSDILVAFNPILISFAIAFIIGITYLILTRYLAGALVWMSILLYFIAIAALTYLCYSRFTYYNDIYELLNTNTSNYTTEQNQTYSYKLGNYSATDQQECTRNKQIFQGISYSLIAVLVLSFFGFLCVYSKIKLAVAIIKTASIFVKDEILITLLPIFTALFTIGLWIWWIITAVYIYSTGTITSSSSLPFASVTLSTAQKQMVWYFLFTGLWINAFIQAVNDFVIASSCCIWYFSQGSGQGAHRAIRTSIYRAFRYHLGSLAFGSLILAIVQLIRIMLEYTKYQLEKANKENKIIKCLMWYLSCCMDCFERFIRFLNRQAYIQIALTGKNFCLAAKSAFETIWANAMRYSLVNGIGGAFIGIGKAFISILTTTIFYFMITRLSTFNSKIISPVLPTIIVFICSYGVSVLFMTVYGMACDTVLACFIYDEDLNKQNGGTSAQHCPETLREFFEMPECAAKMKEQKKE